MEDLNLLGMSLAQIKDYIRGLSPEKARAMLCFMMVMYQKNIAKLATANSKLKTRLKYIQHGPESVGKEATNVDINAALLDEIDLVELSNKVDNLPTLREMWVQAVMELKNQHKKGG